MRIGVQTWGSEGDIRPFLALARGLGAAGHQVTVVYTDVAFTIDPAQAAEASGAACRPLTPSHDAGTMRRVSRDLIRKRVMPARQIARVFEAMLYPMEARLLEAAEALCRENDLVVGQFALYPLAAAAQRQGTPRVSVFTAPTHPSREYVPADAPDLGPLGNRLFWKVAGFGVERMFAGPARRLYAALGLPPPRSLVADVWGSPVLDLVAVSPTLFPPPGDWGPRTRVCGQLAGPPTAPWEPPAPLRRFLAQGPPPVFVTLGSMMATEEDPTAITAGLLEAVRLAGCRALVQADWDRVPGLPEHPDVLRLGRVPHEAVFPHCAAVVHHGGAGTSHAATRAGKPSIVLAYAVDQLFWARALRQAGLAPAPVRRQAFSAGALARALTEVLDSPALRRTAAARGEVMRQEDGVATAVRWLGEAVAGR